MIVLEREVRTDLATLGDLAQKTGYRLSAGESVTVRGVCDDSRRCAPGDLFVAIPGTQADGIRFAKDAMARGAVAVASERDPGLGAPWLAVPSARVAAGVLADLVYGDPSRSLPLVGVTGTNGKTTTAHLIAQLLPGQIGFIGTLGVEYPGASLQAVNTTPGPVALRRHLRAMIDAGCTGCVAEVSSHALDQRRVDGLRFAAAVYTNLSGDHLDYHGSMDAYGRAKARLFAQLEADAVAVLNARDPSCAHLPTKARTIRFAATRIAVEPGGTRFCWRGRECYVPLVGRHNAENAVAALETVCALGANEDEAVALLAHVLPVRGRLEPVQREPFLVVVDYAHTDDALEKALAALREVTTGSVLLVFGCGGDRDRSKRPRMGAVAARLADRVFVTNDNPRSENPERIAAEVVAGLGTIAVTVELDRKAAISEAILAARPGDSVLIAGKGHETYQLLAGRVLPCDDAEIAREALSQP